MKRVIFSILATIFLISLIVCLIMTIKTWEKRRKVIYFPLCFINAILLLIPMIFYYRNCLYISYQVDTALLNNTSGVENFLKNWNMQYFLPNNIYVIVPRNLRYLQFVLDKNIKFSLENHLYPYDIVSKRRW